MRQSKQIYWAYFVPVEKNTMPLAKQQTTELELLWTTVYNIKQYFTNKKVTYYNVHQTIK